MSKKPWTFKTWIMKFDAVDLPIGDLSNDIVGDINFPINDDKQRILDYLKNKHADTTVVDTFLEVWEFYRSST